MPAWNMINTGARAAASAWDIIKELFRAYTGRCVTHLFHPMKVMVILCCILWFCTSCTFDFGEPGVCPYNARLNYRYAGSPDAGQLSMYVDNIHQFLF